MSIRRELALPRHHRGSPRAPPASRFGGCQDTGVAATAARIRVFPPPMQGGYPRFFFSPSHLFLVVKAVPVQRNGEARKPSREATGNGGRESPRS